MNRTISSKIQAWGGLLVPAHQDQKLANVLSFSTNNIILGASSFENRTLLRMGKSDQWIVITIVVLIVLHLSILAIGYFSAKLAYLSAFINLAFGAFIILYWVIDQLRMQEHTIETREVLVLLGEALVVSAATVYIFTSHRDTWIRVLQYISFGIHLLVLILGLVFMLTFKMKMF